MDLSRARRAFAELSTVRVGSVEPDGSPRVVPAWFVWREDAVYVSMRIGSRTWRNVQADPRVSVLLDSGRSWMELAGVVIEGKAEPLAAGDPSLRAPISAWHEKYRMLLSGAGFERFAEEVPELGFLRVDPERFRAWDHATT